MPARPTSAARLIWTRLALGVALALASLLACTAPSVPATAAPQAAPTDELQCLARGGTWDMRNERIGAYCARGTESQCRAAGGQWQRVCMLGTLACVKPHADAGQACRSGHECQGGRCLAVAGASSSESQVGQCLPTDNPCHHGINLEAGRPVPTAIAD